MIKVISFIFGIGAIFLLHDLKKRTEALEAGASDLKATFQAENQAAMDWMTDLEESVESTTISAGQAIGELDTEMKLLQVDFYNFLKTYRHWDESTCQFISLEPYINEKMNIEEVETFLRRRGLKFTTNDKYISPKLP